MNNQEQAHLEKTLTILSDKLQQAQKQYKETKKTASSEQLCFFRQDLTLPL
jgi:hypothetical protein